MKNLWRRLWARFTGRTYIPRIRCMIIGNTGCDQSMNTYTKMPPR